MDAETLAYASIETLVPRVRAGAISPVELTEVALARLERLEPQLNAFVTVTAEAARREAKVAERELAAGQWRGPLHGIPISLKDLYDTEGVRTTGASRILAERVPTRDATVTARLREAGAISLGKCNMAEFAYGYVHPDYGPSRNPWSLDHWTGGSSSGSGGAVAAGIGYASMGSDTGGSIRGPASWSGLVGLKPTYGLVPRTGVLPLSWSLDHCGPMTRTVWDCAAVLQVVAGYDPADPGSGDHLVPDYLAGLDGGVRGLRIGVPREHLSDVQPEVLAAFEASLDRLRALGAHVADVVLPDGPTLAVANLAIVTAEAASIHRDWFRVRPQDYAPQVRDRLEVGLAMPATDYLAAQRARRTLRAEVRAAMRELDLLALPATATTAPLVDEFMAQRPFASTGDSLLRRTALTGPYNLTGLPAISVPCGFSDTGLPIGLQFVGHAWQDALVLRAARAFEQAVQLTRRPPLA